MRHLWAFWRGEEIDPESGHPHLAHAAFHVFGLLAFTERKIGVDDRKVKAQGVDQNDSGVGEYSGHGSEKSLEYPGRRHEIIPTIPPEGGASTDWYLGIEAKGTERSATYPTQQLQGPNDRLYRSKTSESL